MFRGFLGVDLHAYARLVRNTLHSLSDDDPQPLPVSLPSPTPRPVAARLPRTPRTPPRPDRIPADPPGVKAWGIPTGHCIMHTEQTSLSLSRPPPRLSAHRSVLRSYSLRLYSYLPRDLPRGRGIWYRAGPVCEGDRVMPALNHIAQIPHTGRVVVCSIVPVLVPWPSTRTCRPSLGVYRYGRLL